MLKNNKVNCAAEVGYMDTGKIEISTTIPGIPPFIPAQTITVDAKAKGLWGTGLVRFAVKPQLDLLGRVGMDLGDDDGLMFGVGVGYSIDRNRQLRGEYVIRDTVNSLQVNLTFRI